VLFERIFAVSSYAGKSSASVFENVGKQLTKFRW